MTEEGYQRLVPDESSQRSIQVKSAFAEKDSAKSILAHQLAPPHKEPDNPEAKYLKPVIFGGLDGISTIFAFLAGAVGADLHLVSIIALGCAQLFAGAFGMGFGEYLSSEAERQVAQREQAREAWEVENYPEGEIAEMVQIYMDNGLTQEDAETVARTLSKYQDFWVDHMMLTEIGIMPPEGGPQEAMLQGLVMFLSFLVLGSLPLVAYILSRILSDPDEDEQTLSQTAFRISCIAATAALMALGMLKAHLAEMSLIKGGAGMAAQGLLSAGGAFWLGNQLPAWLHIDGA